MPAVSILFRAAALAAAVTLSAVAGARADTLSGETLVEALRGGGYTIYFRHARTDWGTNDKVEQAGDWTSCDPAEMRQLAEAGRRSAARVGDAIRALGIPVGEVLSSEYCRAWQTATALDVGPVEKTRDIMNMRAAAFVGGDAAVVARARRVLATPPDSGSNRVVVGHGNLMRAATGAYAGEGGAGIYAPRPGADNGFVLVAEVTPDGWRDLADRYGAASVD